MKLRVVVASVLASALALLAAGCGQHFVLANVPSEPPVLPNAPKVGVDLYVSRNYSLAETMKLGQRAISYISRTLKVGAIGISWDYVIPSKHSNTVEPTSPYTPSIADIAALTAIAHSYDLQVEYRVLFQLGAQNGRSGYIRPTDRHRWFHSLLVAETPALQLAQQDGVKEFIVGTEATSIEGSPLWTQFYNEAGQVYHGILSYASWGGRPGYGGFFSSKRVLQSVTYYGATAYPEIHLPPTASVAQLTSAWEHFLTAAVSADVLKRTAIDEVGIPAMSGAFYKPQNWNNLKGQENDQVQAHWFQALCAAAGREHLRAVYFWNANLIDNPADPIPSLVKFELRPQSEAAIRNCQRIANTSAEES